MLRVYLDNCCYFRPYDDLSIGNNRNEATAKLFIQSLVKYGSLALVYSSMSITEINDSLVDEPKRPIMRFISDYATTFVNSSECSEIELISANIMKSGIKKKDAVHLACAIVGQCDYFITTDKRVLKYQTSQLKTINPIDFIAL